VNNKELLQNKKLSPFFFEKKLYQYASKTLSHQDRELMRKYSETNRKAKKSLASLLMSLEYLKQLQETGVSKDWVKLQVEREKKKENITKYIILSFLVSSLIIISFLAYRVI
jgi:hypothetical protein